MHIRTFVAGIIAAGTIALGVSTADAQTRITLKSAKSTSSYYVMMVQLSEMLKAQGDFSPTVEESQGSVQNVKESRVRKGNFLFTTPPSLLAAAAAGKKPFEGEAFDNARTLFVMPFVTIHFVARADSGVTTMADFAGKDFIAGGTGSFCERRTKKIMGVLGLYDKVNLIDVESSAKGPAMRNNKVHGYTDCSAHPTPQLSELATTTPVVLIQLTDSERQKIMDLDPLSGPVTIAAGTYTGQDMAIETVGVPVGAYGTTEMTDEVAYAITKTFWEQKEKLAGQGSWWKGVTADQVKLLGAQVHPGAARYYKEIGVDIGN